MHECSLPAVNAIQKVFTYGVSQTVVSVDVELQEKEFTFWLKGMGHLSEVELAFCYRSQQCVSAIWRLLTRHDGTVGDDLGGCGCSGAG